MGWTKPKEAPADWDDAKITVANFNSRALNALFNVVTNEEFKKISSTETAKEAWTILQTTYGGTKAVKDSKLQRLTTSFEEIKMEEDKMFDKFYVKLKDKVNSTFNLSDHILEPKIVRNVLKSLPERFHAKITVIEESKDIDTIPLTGLIGNLQTYELGFTRLGKGTKSKNMALKAKSNETDEYSDNEDSKMKSYITRQFKKFIKNANMKSFHKDRKQSSSSQFKSQDRGKKDEQDDIHTTYAKLYKVSKKHEKLYRLSTKKLSEVELEREELSTIVDEANQTIGELRFENNFFTKRTRKLEAELFQVRAQLERTSSAKLDEMMNLQKSTSNKTGLGYELSNSSPNITSSSKIVFVSPANDNDPENNEAKIEIASENLDKGKSILGAPPKIEKKETRSPKSNKTKNKKSQPKKPHFSHHYGASGHTHPNCYEWLAT